MNENRKIKVVLLEPLKMARVVEIDASINAMQEIVGGLIEAIYPFNDNVCLVCNDEGKINGMPLNRAVCDDNGNILDIIAGRLLSVAAVAKASAAYQKSRPLATLSSFICRKIS